MDYGYQEQVRQVDPELTLGPASTTTWVPSNLLSTSTITHNNPMDYSQSWQGALDSSGGDRKRKREWNAGNQSAAAAPTVDAGVKLSDPWVELRPQPPLPPGWEQCLDLQV